MSARILVVDDQPANVRLLEAKLQAEYFDVCTAVDGFAAIEAAKLEQPDLILLDVMMPGMDGYETCRLLKDEPRTRHIPVVMVTALDQREDRIRGLESGADDFLTKPIDDVTLFARVRSLLRLKTVLDELRHRESSDALSYVMSEPIGDLDSVARAVVISGDPRAATRYAAAMPAQVRTQVETDPVTGLEAARSNADLLIVDLTSPGFDGLRLCARIRADAATRQLPILAVINPGDTPSAVRALDLGVNDIIHRPVDAGEMMARVSTQLRRKRYADRLRTQLDESLEMAITDPLTGLHNRRYIASRLHQAMESSNNGGAPVSLLIADIDHFKSINDRYGHEGGDYVLRGFAERVQRDLRALDLAARYGGEEFVIVMPGAGLAEARGASERLRASIASEPFDLGDGRSACVTVSIGCAQAEDGESAESLLRRADEALYLAKDEGRNRVEAAHSAAA
ncbi:PleD family two-component system response regulator [Maricaulis salignorans]|uniref:diguanylate cyclase n=1 Tax=Maricaulis salignorans TaxID=144026 RepID=A0A1G9UJ41_9PROT|nr:PleD family two-component system response regulator [Maricaulis salignorans]SDM59926.1 response regulator receiver modulated diguanylate cyclase [Maricaulis salignorans]